MRIKGYRASDEEYKKSLSLEIPVKKISKKTKELYHLLRARDSVTEEDLQKYADSMCKDLKIPKVMVKYSGKEPHSHDGRRLKSKVHGTYRGDTSETSNIQNIRIYKLTAMRGQVRAPKATVDTLIHELCHHIDKKMFKLPTSPHTAGFYKRITQIKECQS